MRRHFPQNRVDVLLKPHVEHFVRLVQNNAGNLRQTDGPPVDQIQQPPRSGHDNSGALFDLPHLCGNAGAAVHGDNTDVVQTPCKVLQIINNLQTQLPRRTDDHRLGPGKCRIDPLNHRQTVSAGFSRPGLGKPHKIPVPGKQHGYCLFLNRHGIRKSQFFQDLNQFRPEP